MDAEYEAWWGFVLACLGRSQEAMERASTALEASGRTEIAGLVPWIDVISRSLAGEIASVGALKALRSSFQTGNVDAFVSSYRVCKGVLRDVATDKSLHRELRLILSRANDQAFGPAIGLHVPSTTSSRTTLTKREHDVVALLVQGAANKEIARRSSSRKRLRKSTCATSTRSSAFDRDLKRSFGCWKMDPTSWFRQRLPPTACRARAAAPMPPQ